MTRNYGRDLNIGYPSEKTLNDIYDKLDEVEAKVKANTDTQDETNFELKKISLGTGLITGVDLDEEAE